VKTMIWILAAVGAATAAGVACAAAVATYFYVSDGTIDIRVHSRPENGDEVSIRCPAVLARVALAWIPASALEIDADAIEILPVAAEAIERLELCPDAKFVEAVSGDERVVISKEGARLVVDVETKEESVRVAVPFTAAKAALRAISRREIRGCRPGSEPASAEVPPAAAAARGPWRMPEPSPARP
jgi:hypothetical protein